MSINYYLVPPKDGSLMAEMTEPIHVAKSSGGWRVLFESYGVDSTRWPTKSETDRLRVATVADVRALMTRALAEGWTFEDEYGQDTDVEEFWRGVEERQGRTRHDDPDYTFLSEDGYDFSTGPFT